jgi:hypothetical protein
LAEKPPEAYRVIANPPLLPGNSCSKFSVLRVFGKEIAA